MCAASWSPKRMNITVPRQIRMLVRIPAGLPRSCRSSPSTAPQSTAIPTCVQNTLSSSSVLFTQLGSSRACSCHVQVCDDPELTLYIRAVRRASLASMRKVENPQNRFLPTSVEWDDGEAPLASLHVHEERA